VSCRPVVIKARPYRLTLLVLLAWLLANPVHADASGRDTIQLSVTSLADSGPGSLRWALEEAALQAERKVRIDFGDRDGLFSQPQRIELESSLPPIVGRVEINGFIRGLLWRAYGVTISGGEQHRLFEVLPGASLRLGGITLSHGRAESGGGLLNQGELIIEGVSLFHNQASGQGGAIDNRGRLYLVNSTLAWNGAEHGGAIASSGSLAVVNATLYQNRAEQGAALWSSGDLHLANSILAGDGADECHNQGPLSAQSSHNLIHGQHHGCGRPILSEDPGLEGLGYFNGPTQVFPVGGNSPVVNLGLNEAALNAAGQRLTWDQRGNGDPRFASGFTDLGAFERQGQLPERFIVNSLEDNGLRACHPGAARPSCPLRAALELAAAARDPTPVHFDSRVFDQPRELVLENIPPGTDVPLLIDGQGVAPVHIVLPSQVPWRLANGVEVRIDPSLQGGRP
jgi:hypothetical protein